MKTLALCVACGLLLSTAGCSSGSGEEPLSWEEFQAQAYRGPDGVYVVNGDEPAQDLDRLHDLYLDYLDTVAEVADDGIGSTRQALAVNTVGGFDDLFPNGSTLSYCVAASGGQGFTAAEYSAVVSAMDAATSDWEASANINFVHDSSQDGACDAFNPNVTFDVGRVCTGSFLARAFFPSFPRSSRNILVDCTAFGSIAPFTLAGILKHESGHTIGFRHEHTRPESGACFEDNSWRALTAYDSSSVMHYPQCNGTQFGDLALTGLDRAGASSVYPF